MSHNCPLNADATQAARRLAQRLEVTVDGADMPQVMVVPDTEEYEFHVSHENVVWITKKVSPFLSRPVESTTSMLRPNRGC
jgi:hypothetical protein